MNDDVVAELDALLAQPALDYLMQRARDEIVALREIAARPSPELHMPLPKERDDARAEVRRLLDRIKEARDATLQEAAQACERLRELLVREDTYGKGYGDGMRHCVAAIRALKGEGV